MSQQPLAASRAPHVGRYRLLEVIGEGGMGVVHLAEAPDGRQVALKLLRPHVVGDDEGRQRLAREVASLRRVSSPRVAGVLDADPWGRTPYVVTRYVPGPSLHEHVRRHGPITGPALARLATGLAEAVIAVHSAGVLHRDIKPSNVLLEDGSPVLIDFGLARLAEDTRLTQTGWLMGTPGYLAPEILYGDEATTASDVHSWAATLVLASTGRPPFGTGPPMAVMDRVRRGEHDLSAVPTALRPSVQAALAAEPVERPTMPALLADLQRNAPTARPGGGSRTVPMSLAAPTADTRGPRTRVVTAATRQAPPRDVPGPFAGPAAPPRAAADGSRLRRAALLLCLVAAVTTGFAVAPYLALLGLAAAAQLLRTLSWTTESARGRQLRRGRRRWYDGVVALLSAPWYLLVAAAGTCLLVLWAAVVVAATGAAYLLFRGPVVPGLLLVGAVLSLATWWGPGGRRLRTPTRRLVGVLGARGWSGWPVVLLLLAVTALCCYGLASGGVDWAPAPGPPWRDGTVLAGLLHWW